MLGYITMGCIICQWLRAIKKIATPNRERSTNTLLSIYILQDTKVVMWSRSVREKHMRHGNAKCSLYILYSVSILAQISVRSAQKLYIFVIYNDIFRIRVSKKKLCLILKKAALMLNVPTVLQQVQYHCPSYYTQFGKAVDRKFQRWAGQTYAAKHLVDGLIQVLLHSCKTRPVLPF